MRDSLGFFESFDDQIMGGISQSALLAGRVENVEGGHECAVFSGVVRVAGGGFACNRMKLLSEPLDLSDFSGIYLKARGDGQIYKVNLRTGEKALKPGAADTRFVQAGWGRRRRRCNRFHLGVRI